jgi:exonuclease SbcC
MRPLTLTVSGFTAFRDEQTVSFEELDLFVITGPTGAGKTSLLDAIAFALYGEVPRLGGSQGTKDLITLGQALARVTLEFSVGDKGRFRVVRRLARRGPQTAVLERWEGGAWVPAVDQGGVRPVNAALIEVVGLDFDSFCRAVVLPQGEFHEFLRGDAAERRKVLFSLLGVDYFKRMAELAGARARLLRTKIETTEQILAEQYSDAVPERIAELEARGAETATRAEAVATALREATERLASAEAERRREALLASRLSELQAVRGSAQALAARCEQAASGAQRAEELLAEAAAATAARRRELEAAEAAVGTAEAAHGTADALAALTAAAATLAQTAADETLAAERSSAAEAAAVSTAELRSEADTALAALDGALSEARTAADACGVEVTDARRRLEEMRAAAVAAGKRETALGDARAALQGAELGVVEAATAADGAETAWRAAEHVLEERRRHAALAEIAVGVGVGEPCPVCGVTLGTAIHVDGEAGELLAAAREAEARARGLRERTLAEAAQARTRAETCQEQVGRAEQELRAALGDHTDIGALTDAGRALASSVEALVQRHAERMAALEALTERTRVAREHAGRAGADAAAAQAAAQAARDRLAEVRNRRDQASAVLADHFGGVVPLDAADQIAQQLARLRSALEEVRAARRAVDAATTAEAAVREQTERARGKLGRIDIELAGLVSRGASVADGLPDDLALEAWEAPAGEDRAAALAALTAWATEAETAIAREGALAGERLAAGEGEVVRIALGLELPAPTPADALRALGAADRTAVQAAASAASAIEHARRRLAERQTLEGQIAEERRRAEVFAALALDLRTDRFGEYIIQETMAVLAARASDELLRISDSRYSLATDGGDFEVIDHANADERRSVKTLSGGETFLASLSLALALSRHIGELAGEGLGARLEAVFIDEGFGTLDPATLDEVIDALERLREENLIVGVISHVPELAQRIGVGIEVHKDGGRSTVTMNLVA